MKGRFEILAVDDDERDADLLHRVLGAGADGVGLERVDDGGKALAFLRRQGRYAEKPRPHLVLLDLHMPRMDGRAFLAERRADPSLRTVPVVVLSSAAGADEVRECYALGANCFVAKPVGFEAYRAAVRALVRFWSRVPKLPAA